MTEDSTNVGEPWLVVIDMQVIFGDPSSGWCTPGFASIVPNIQRLMDAHGTRVVFTRFVAPETPTGAWVPYYQQWPFALVPATDPLYDVVADFNVDESPVVSCTTFGKWGVELAEVLGDSSEMVMVGVSTDCCVLSTALAAADAGVHVRVVSDACAGVSDDDHRRALEAMALYGPLIEITDSASVLSAL